jgi:hypothetical protein
MKTVAGRDIAVSWPVGTVKWNLEKLQGCDMDGGQHSEDRRYDLGQLE